MIKEQLQKVLNCCQKKYQLPHISMKYKDINCSYAGYNEQTQQYWIIISTDWLYDNKPAIAILLHEIAHIIIRFNSKFPSQRTGHGKLFKYYEGKLLLDFGLKAIRYKKAYYDILKTVDEKYTWSMNHRFFSRIHTTPTFTFGKQLLLFT